MSELRQIPTHHRAHFSRLCSPVHGCGRVCPGCGGSRSRPSDMDSRKPSFTSGAAKTSVFEPQRAVLQALTLLGGALSEGNADGARCIFGAARCVWATARRQDPPKTGLMLHLSGRRVVRQIPTRQSSFGSERCSKPRTDSWPNSTRLRLGHLRVGDDVIDSIVSV